MKPYYETELGKLYHGDCLEIMPQLEPVDLVLTSPPYNVGMEYEKIDEWVEYYSKALKWITASFGIMKSGAIIAINIPKEIRLKKEQIKKYGRRVEKLSNRYDDICEAVGFLPRESILWVKGKEPTPISTTFCMGSDNNLYIRPTCETILLHSKERYFYDGGTGRRGRKAVPWLDETKDVWWIVPERKNGHPCPFPVEIPTRLINLFTIARKFIPVVCDPMFGSGTTAVACERLNRRWIGIEIEEKYCAIAKQRIDNERKQRKLF